jgi:predicted DsbA family dithiol-disulfide isomerase
MRVEIWADLVCPFCYLGKRRFEKALAGFEHRAAVEVVHRSFELDPHMPKGETVGQTEMLVGKYGVAAERAAGMQAQLERTAAAEGLEYHLTDGKTGNTFDAHRLVHLAQAAGIGEPVIERFYRAHFTERRSLFDRDSLVALAAEAGLDAAEARRVLDGEAFTDAVLADEREAHELGATGVPFFVIADRYAVSGAQPAELFAEALTRAWTETAQSPV